MKSQNIIKERELAVQVFRSQIIGNRSFLLGKETPEMLSFVVFGDRRDPSVATSINALVPLSFVGFSVPHVLRFGANPKILGKIIQAVSVPVVNFGSDWCINNQAMNTNRKGSAIVPSRKTNQAIHSARLQFAAPQVATGNTSFPKFTRTKFVPQVSFKVFRVNHDDVPTNGNFHRSILADSSRFSAA